MIQKLHKTGLQKFTKRVDEDESLSQSEKDLVKKIATGPKLTRRSFMKLSDQEREELNLVKDIAANKLKFFVQDIILDRLEIVGGEDGNLQIWDRNHGLITDCIDKFVGKYKSFPTRTHISRTTGLSRVTVNKHLSGFIASDQYKERQDEFAVMRDKVLAVAYNKALSGDLVAARLFIEATDGYLLPENKRNVITVIVEGENVKAVKI